MTDFNIKINYCDGGVILTKKLYPYLENNISSQTVYNLEKRKPRRIKIKLCEYYIANHCEDITIFLLKNLLFLLI